jgi:hypothetical protein
MSLGISRQDALGFGGSRKGEWRLSMTSGVQRTLSIEHLTTAGLVCLEERWQKLAPLREPPSADPHAMWCGRVQEQSGPYPDGIVRRDCQ